MFRKKRIRKKWMCFIRLLVLLLFFISPISLAKNQTVYFEPQIVELSGTIAVLTLPGPPNYLSIKNGDAAETGGYLVLGAPVDVKLVPNIQMNNDELEHNISIIQLVLQNNDDWKKMENGNHVHINGTLFHAISAHHHTRVLLDVKKIQVTSKEKIVNSKVFLHEVYSKF